jgi:predicted DNA-binding WGR domain protein
LQQALPRFAEWQPVLALAAELPEPLTRALRALPATLPQLEAAMAARTLDDIRRREPALAQFDANQKRVHADRLEQLYSHWLTVNAEAVLERHRDRFLEKVTLASASSARLTKEQAEFKRSYNAGRRELEHEFGKTMRYKSVRGLLHGDAGEVVLDLKPVWLMSPLSVSDTLPIDERVFDVAIFDEASQVPLEEAVPVLVRAEQVIVSGDQMQLPPTNFFSATRTGEETVLIDDDEQDGGTVAYELDSNSFLAHAARNLPSTMLEWHYRSRSESLISFSNAAFYEGRLLTVPERQPSVAQTTPIPAASVEEGTPNGAHVLDRPVSFHFIENGRYEARRNLKEADYIARLVRGLLTARERPTIGIVAFSEAQQTAIETALERLAATDADFGARLEEAYEREEDGQFTGLLVKNLENIQGDERDVIILSICYGYGHDGRMLMNFGPINQSGGERRLNVAFSRAKQHMAVVSSIQHTEIKNVYNDGANALRNYLQYTASLSAGDLRSAEAVLRSLTPRAMARQSERAHDVVIEQLATALTRRGLDATAHVGQSRFQCDLAVRAAGEPGFRLAVFVDGNHHNERASDIVEREVLKPRLLRSFGWSVCHVLAKDWYDDPDAVVARIERELAGDGERDDSGIDGVIAEIEASATQADAVAPVASDNVVPATAAPQTQAVARLGPLPAGAARCFEFTEGGSQKFWQIAVDGTELVVSYGRIGTEGQVKRKPCPSADAARREAERLIREKLAKGYRETI